MGHIGKPNTAKEAIKKVLLKQVRPSEVFEEQENFWQLSEEIKKEPENIITGQSLSNTGRVTENTIVMRSGSVVRNKPSKDGTYGKVNIVKTKAKALRILNRKEGIQIFPRKKSKKGKSKILQDDLWSQISDDDKQLISMNLLEKSGLSWNRQERDANLIQISIEEACRYLKSDDLATCLDKHFGLDRQNTEGSADGCTIASLLLMNAMMLHQRIAVGKWLPGLKTMDALKASSNAKDQFSGQWNKITRHDFHPVFMPALDVVDVIVEESGRLAGLNKALKHLATESERIAESYADMGSDHAGPLFNKVMGNQASDGAFFTRPTAASLLAKLTLDAANEGETPDWKDRETWKSHRSVDLACGSGTLISALMTDMKRRAREQEVEPKQLGDLQKLAVEEIIAGLDMNPVSLQLAAAQMMSGAKQVKYKKMLIYQMPYGNDPDLGITVGSLELFSQQVILPRPKGDLGQDDEKTGDKQVRVVGKENHSASDEQLETRLETAVDAVKDVRIVIMNPPFSNRTEMGKKFDEVIQKSMRKRIDSFSKELVKSDKSMNNVANKNSIAPMFVALAEKCLSEQGIMGMIRPTIALTGPSGLIERKFLAERYHIHTLLTCHQPGNINLAVDVNEHHSIIIAKRHQGSKPPPTRVISLDRFPIDEEQVEEFHRIFLDCKTGLIANGWGEVSLWPAEHIKAGDWSSAAFRSPELARAAARAAMDQKLLTIDSQKIVPSAVLHGGGRKIQKCDKDVFGSFPVLHSAGEAAQKQIEAVPDSYRVSTKQATAQTIWLAGGEISTHAESLHKNAGHLLIASTQSTKSARITAVASEKKYLGIYWMPVPEITFENAKAVSVFLNSTLGRIQLMRNPGSQLMKPSFSPSSFKNIRIPNLKDQKAVNILVKCYNVTKDIEVPQYCEGECEVRRLWDEAVAKACDWDANELAKLRLILHQEPHVCGIGYNQFHDMVD